MDVSSSKPSFGIYFDPDVRTSGARFFRSLYEVLADDLTPLSGRPNTILFNISAPLKEIIKAKLRGQEVVLRVDGLYCDKLSARFLRTFNPLFRIILSAGLKFRSLHDVMAHIANFLNRNYSGFLKISLSDRVIYQSKFSCLLHQHYFPKKPYSIIVNGARYKGHEKTARFSSEDTIHLVTIYDEWKASKRLYDTINFVRWLNAERGYRASLTILGYTGSVPESAPQDMKFLIEESEFVSTQPKFSEFESEVAKKLFNADVYLTYTYRDPCPNAVVESMAFGLPVLGLASGGMPDIVGDAGVLVPINDFENGLFDAGRYETEFPVVEAEKLEEGLIRILKNRKYFEDCVRRRFEKKLGIDVVAKSYLEALTNAGAHREKN